MGITILLKTYEHLQLCFLSLIVAMTIAIPLGIFFARTPFRRVASCFVRIEFQDLQKKYLYSFSEPTFMDQALMYLSLANQQIDVGDGYSTDGLISSFHLTLLEDDQKVFPVYDAVPLIRSSALQKHPFLKEILNRLSGKITTDSMRRMNEDADKKGKIHYGIAKDFLIRENLIQS